MGESGGTSETSMARHASHAFRACRAEVTVSLPAAASLSRRGGRLCGPRCSLRAMNDSDDVYLVGLDVIDNSVRTFLNFTYLREFNFRDDAARLGERADLLGASGEAVNDSQGVLR